MIDAVCGEIKQKLSDFCANTDLQRLTPSAAEQMSQALGAALGAGGVAGYRAFLRQYECEEDTILRDGTTLRLKMMSEKSFMTPFGKQDVPQKFRTLTALVQ